MPLPILQRSSNQVVKDPWTGFLKQIMIYGNPKRPCTTLAHRAIGFPTEDLTGYGQKPLVVIVKWALSERVMMRYTMAMTSVQKAKIHFPIHLPAGIR